MCDSNIRFSKESAICKILLLRGVDDEAMQIHDDRIMTDYPMKDFYRDARINRIFERTNEIQRMVIRDRANAFKDFSGDGGMK